MGAIMLIAAVVGIVIVDQVSVDIWTDTQVLNENFTTVYNGTTDTLANLCITQDTITAYDWTNATTILAGQYLLTPQVFPHRTTQQITWASGGFDHNGTDIGINYTYGCTYGSNTAFRLIMEYFAVIVGVAALALGGMWLYMKGGL